MSQLAFASLPLFPFSYKADIKVAFSYAFSITGMTINF